MQEHFTGYHNTHNTEQRQVKYILPYEGGQFIELLGAPRYQFNLLLATAVWSTTQEETQSFGDVCLEKVTKRMFIISIFNTQYSYTTAKSLSKQIIDAFNEMQVEIDSTRTPCVVTTYIITHTRTHNSNDRCGK